MAALAPVVLVGGTRQTDAFQLESVAVDGHVLAVEVSYPGGCRNHEFHLQYRRPVIPIWVLEVRATMPAVAGSPLKAHHLDPLEGGWRGSGSRSRWRTKICRVRCCGLAEIPGTVDGGNPQKLAVGGLRAGGYGNAYPTKRRLGRLGGERRVKIHQTTTIFGEPHT